MPLLTNQSSRLFYAARPSAWYRAGGAPLPVAAYCPKGAASLAASYTNLANNGAQYNAAPGVAPTFAAATGWTFNGTTQYLTTGVNSAANMTVLIRLSGVTGVNGTAFGSRDASLNGLFIIAVDGGGTNRAYQYGSNRRTIAGNVTAGVMAIAGTACYLNGVQDVNTLDNVVSNPVAMYIGAINNNGSPLNYMAGNVLAVAIYNVALSGAAVAAISAAMAAL